MSEFLASGGSSRRVWSHTEAGSFLAWFPERLIGDKAYDALDRRLHEEYGIEMIAPNRNRSQDARKLRRYRRRWKVERLFAWMRNLRRLVTRWEYHVENFLGFVRPHLPPPLAEASMIVAGFKHSLDAGLSSDSSFAGQ